MYPFFKVKFRFWLNCLGSLIWGSGNCIFFLKGFPVDSKKGQDSLNKDSSVKEKLVKPFLNCMAQTICQRETCSFFVIWICSRNINTHSIYGNIFNAMFTLSRIVLAPAGKPYRIELLFTNKNGDYGAISITERSCDVPITKVARHISVRFCATLECSVNRS